jgi:hypothetical protein
MQSQLYAFILNKGEKDKDALVPHMRSCTHPEPQKYWQSRISMGVALFFMGAERKIHSILFREV